jgi:hypothetical protein
MRVPVSSACLCGLLLLSLCQPCFGQSFSVGVKAGGQLTDDLSSPSSWASSESKRYTLGPMATLELPCRLALEVDLLYRRTGYRTSFGYFGGGFNERVRANSWEMPILVQYKLPGRLLHPYVAAGIAPRRSNGTYDSDTYTINPQTGQITFSRGHDTTNWSASVGTVVGAGVRFGLGPLDLSPELRYTRWNNTPVNIQGSYGYSFQSAQNQVDVLVGVTWPRRK